MITAAESPRARFFSFAPIGVGTAQVESLDGFILRLAAKHRVSATVLRRRLAEEERPGAVAVDPWPSTLEGTGVSAMLSAWSLAKLTLQPSVARLGLANLARHVSPVDLLATKNSWCPQCLREMLMTRLFYIPQAWRLHCYTHCGRHDQQMQYHCPHCHRSTSQLDRWFAAMGTCPWCRESFLTQPVDAPPVAPQGSTWTDRIISGELESMCAALAGDFGDQFEPLVEPGVSWILREGTRLGTVSSLEAVAREAGIGATVLGRVEHDTMRSPSLQTLVRVCVACGVSVEGALRRNFATFRRPQLDRPLQSASVTHTPRRPMERDEVRREVIAILRRGEVPTLAQLTVRLGLTPARLRDLLDQKLRMRLMFRHALRQRARVDARYRELVGKIIGVRAILLAMGRAADPIETANHLGRKTAASPNFLAAYADAVLAS